MTIANVAVDGGRTVFMLVLAAAFARGWVTNARRTFARRRG